MTKRNCKPSPQYLKGLFRYDPKTGKLFWRERPSEHFSTEKAKKMWHTRYLGQVAGWIGPHGYRYVGIDGRPYFAHRVAYAVFHGKWPSKNIDHINGDRDDNRIKNLRNVDTSTNQRNSKMYKTNTSGYCGVTLNKKTGKWRAGVHIMGKHIQFGSFDNIEDAAQAREAGVTGLGFTERHGK